MKKGRDLDRGVRWTRHVLRKGRSSQQETGLLRLRRGRGGAAGSAQLGPGAWPPCGDRRETRPGGGGEPFKDLEYGRGVMKGAFERVLSVSAGRRVSRNQPRSLTVTACWRMPQTEFLRISEKQTKICLANLVDSVEKVGLLSQQ